AVLGLGLTECAEHEAARQCLDQAIKGMDRFGYRRLVCWYTAWRAEAWLGMGELERSEGDAREALAASLALGSPWGAAISERTLGRVATARESLSAGGQHLMRALGILERIEARLEIAVTRFDLARVAFLEGDPVADDHVRAGRLLLAGVAAPAYGEGLQADGGDGVGPTVSNRPPGRAAALRGSPPRAGRAPPLSRAETAPLQAPA